MIIIEDSDQSLVIKGCYLKAKVCLYAKPLRAKGNSLRFLVHDITHVLRSTLQER